MGLVPPPRRAPHKAARSLCRPRTHYIILYTFRIYYWYYIIYVYHTCVVCVCVMYLYSRSHIIIFGPARERTTLLKHFERTTIQLRSIPNSFDMVSPPACLVRVYTFCTLLLLQCVFIIFIRLTRFKTPDRVSRYMPVCIISSLIPIRHNFLCLKTTSAVRNIVQLVV